MEYFFMKVLFVCRGNVARSQWAEAFFKHYSKKHSAESAGTDVGISRGYSLDIYAFVCEVIAQDGIDIRNNQRKQLTPELVEEHNLIVSIAGVDYGPDYLLKSPKTIYWDVNDPKGLDYNFHTEAKDKIKGLVKKLIQDVEN